MTERATITVSSAAVLTMAEQLATDALRAASVRDWATAGDGLTDAIRDLCDAARHLPGHGPEAITSRVLAWDDDADGFRLAPLVRDALRGDSFLAEGLLAHLGGTFHVADVGHGPQRVFTPAR